MNEKEIQKNLINNLINNGWTKNNNIKSSNAIIKRFFEILQIRNKNIFNDNDISELSPQEKDRLITKIMNHNNPSEARDVLLDEKITLTLDNGNNVYIDIFDQTNYKNNIFEVAEEVTMETDNKRMDILLLINGIPVSNIELKAEHISLREAINQLKEYSYRYTSLLKFVQLLIASNNKKTVFFANNSKFNDKYIFNWSYKNNINIDELTTFVREFLSVFKFHRYVSNFIVNKREQKALLALRGYQVHGLEAILNRLKEDGINNNGFLWHATGSGKTITSFLASQMIVKEIPKYKKVIFLVDRKELDTQTFNEYNAFLPKYLKLPSIDSTRNLYSALKKSEHKLIVSTINKMNDLVVNKQGKYDDVLFTLKQEDIVIIFDEGHRSQSGDMHSRIKKAFIRARLIGFTGTPIFSEELSENNKLTRTTKEIFDKNLHSYLMKDAIDDENVLHFNITYMQNDKDVSDLSKYMRSMPYVESVTKDIINNFDKRSRDRKYSSILVASDIETAMSFYKEFKDYQKIKINTDNKYKKINVAITFSVEDNYKDESLSRLKFYEEAINDFNKVTNSNERATTSKERNQYNNRLQRILKDEINFPEINLVIVVDRLLTGFDAKKLNTLYVARDIKLHTLVQAFSRTNRVLDEDKKYGNIISYVPDFEPTVEKAIKIYSDEQNTSGIFMRNYEEYLKELNALLYDVKNIDYDLVVSDPIEHEKEGKAYINKVNKIINLARILKTMDEPANLETAGQITDNDLDLIVNRSSKIKAVSKKKQKEHKIEINPYDEIDVPLSIFKKYHIDATYISNILHSSIIDNRNGNEQDAVKSIDNLLLNMAGQNDEPLIKSLNRFKETLIMDKNIELKKFYAKEIADNQNKLEKNYGLTKDDMYKAINDYQFYGNFDNMKVIEEKLKELYKNKGSYPERTKLKNEALEAVRDCLRFQITANELMVRN